jgi:serine/threonine protein kinase
MSKLQLKMPSPDKSSDQVNAFFEGLPADIPQIDIENIDIRKSREIQSGTFGTTYMSEDKTRVTKVVHLSRQLKNVPKLLVHIENEIVNYHKISTLCPDFFCKFIGYHFNKSNLELYIVMEHCGVDLFEFYNQMETSYMKSYARFSGNRNAIDELDIESMTIKKIICFRILKALHCLHKHGFAHLDLKPENIVISSTPEKRYITKFIDAGSLTRINKSNESKTQIYVEGTPEYMAPEIRRAGEFIDNNRALKTLDIYAFGMLCKNILSKKEIWSIFAGSSIVNEMCDPDPKKRPDVDRIMFYLNPSMIFANPSVFLPEYVIYKKKPTSSKSSKSKSTSSSSSKSKSLKKQ